MKEELKSLKEVTIEIVKEKEDLRKQKNFFNMKVEEKKSELNIDEVFKAENKDSFEAAELLHSLFPQIHSIVSTVKEQHPKYGEKRVKEITSIALKEFMTLNDYCMDFIDKIDLLVDNYFLYESCGYFKLLAREEKINNLEESAKVSAGSILNESKEIAIKTGSSIVNTIKPYGEIAKSQMNDAKDNAKKLVNLGSKKLIKFLENIEEKTKRK